MLKSVRWLTLFCFTLWIIPLGAFIAPEKEGKTCGGQRAVCLCSHYRNKDAAPDAGKQFSNAGANSQEQTGYWGQSGHQFILLSFGRILPAGNSGFSEIPHIIPTVVCLRSIDHVPKA